MPSTQGFDFQQGLSGLSAAARELDVIGNNIANAGTVGFKRSTVAFHDLYSNSIASVSTNPVGIGVKVQAVTKVFSQGNISTTNNPLDIAINGEGFFQVLQGQDALYTRAGQLRVDSAGFLVTPAGEQVTGKVADANGQIDFNNLTQLVPIRLDTAEGAPTATKLISGQFNLDSRVEVPSLAFNPTDSTTFNGASSSTVYDSLGNAHVFTIYFRKADDAGNWEVRTQLDSGTVGDPKTVAFDASGRLAKVDGQDVSSTADPKLAQSFALPAGSTATSPLAFDFSLAGSTQFAAAYSANTFNQDGFASGRLASFSIEPDGVLLGRYSNGTSRPIGLIVLHYFRNPEGLRPISGNLFAATLDSGQATANQPGRGSVGVLQSGALEESNVDLTEELVKLIAAQRFYQANTKTIQSQNEVSQSLINMS